MIRQSAFIRYAVAAAAVLVALAIKLTVPDIGRQTPFLLFFAAIMIAAWYGGFGPGLFSSVVSALLASYFFLPDRALNFDRADLLQCVVFALEGVLISAVSSARAHAIEAERRQRQWLDTTLRSVGEGVIATARDGRIMYMNTMAEAITGWNTAEASGRPVTDILPLISETTGAAVQNPAERVLRGLPRPAQDKVILKSRRGDSVPIAENATPILGRTGDLAGAVVIFRDVTEQRRAEESLRESEERYRTIAETASDGIITIDGDGNILFASPACERIFGYTAAEITGNKLTILIPSNLREANIAGLSRYQATGAPKLNWDGAQLPGLHRDGREIPLEISLGEFSRNGKRFVTAVIRDITERRRIEEVLRSERRRTEEALEMHRGAEQQVMLLLDASATLLTSLRADEVLSRILELAGQFVRADAYAVWRDDAASGRWKPVCSRGLSEAYQRVDIGAEERSELPSEPVIVEDVDSVSLVSKRREGYRVEGIRSLLIVPLHIHGRPSGTITFYYRSQHRAAPADVRIAAALGNLASSALTTAELYEVQTRLRADAQAAERRSTFLSEATTVLASSLDYETTLATVARQAVPHFADWCAVDIVGDGGEVQRVAVAHVDPAKVAWAKEMERLYPADPNAQHGARYVLRTGNYEVINDISDEVLASIARDGEHLRMLREVGFKSLLCAPLIARDRTLGALTFATAESGRTFGAAEIDLALHLARRASIAVDNAELYRSAERRRREAEETSELLRQSNEDLEQFAYVSSHDLQEPLRMIGSYVQLLERRYRGKLDQEADEFINFIVEGVDRMQRLLHDLLDYARVGYRGQVVAGTSADGALKDALANLKVAIDESNACITRDPLPQVKADPVQMTQLFQNLIANAIKFRREEPLQVRVSASRGEGEWVFAVRDNALGFDPIYAKKAFTIFQRLHGRDYSGTGIGLAICKRIVERHGGRIWVESQPQAGSTFYFTLPDVSTDIPGPPLRRPL